MKTKQPDLSRRQVLKIAGTAAAVAIAPGAVAAAARTPGNKRSQTTTKRTANLFMTDVGTGKNVLFLHGWTCDSEDWSWQLPVFESKYRVIAADLRGHGRSEVMPSGSYAPLGYVADIEALVAAKHAGKKFIIVGHSMGGQIAARLAARRPDLVEAVVSVDGSLGFSSDVAKVFKKTVHDMAVDDPGIVVPDLFKHIYAPSTDPGFKCWHARRVKGMPADVVRESFAPLFFRTGSGRHRQRQREVLPQPDGALLSPVSRPGAGRAHAALVFTPEIEGRCLEPFGPLDHAGSQAGLCRSGNGMDRRALTRPRMPMSSTSLRRIRPETAQRDVPRRQRLRSTMPVERAFHAGALRKLCMWIAAFALGVDFMGNTILTPLYPIYQRRFGFPELTVTMIYAVYVIGNLAVLFFFGRLSDQIGRRSATLAAFAITMLAALGFLFANGTGWLFAARIVNGLGASLGATTLTAWIAELQPENHRGRAAIIASTANLAGLAGGALLAGLLAQYAPWPLRLIYVVFLLLLTTLAALLWTVPETVAHSKVTMRDVFQRPRIGVPPGIRVAFLAPAALSFTGFALAGFYAALGPGLLMQSLHQQNLVVIGGIVAMFFAVSATTAVLTRGLQARPAMVVTLALLLIGLGLLTAAEAMGSMALLLLGTVAAGAVLALAYRASLQIINEIAPQAQRAEVVASFQIVHFIANSLPVIGVGLLALIVSMPTAHRIFALVLVVLTSAACAIGLRHLQRD